jgi:hypothetical protein
MIWIDFARLAGAGALTDRGSKKTQVIAVNVTAGQKFLTAICHGKFAPPRHLRAPPTSIP